MDRRLLEVIAAIVDRAVVAERFVDHRLYCSFLSAVSRTIRAVDGDDDEIIAAFENLKNKADALMKGFEYADSFVERVEQLCIARGMTKLELKRRAKVGRNILFNCYDKEIRPKTYKKIADVLGVSPEFLAGKELKWVRGSG